MNAPKRRAAWLIVAAKEVRENLRDRRTITTSLIFGPLMFPALLVIMLTVIGNQKKDDLEKPLSLPVVGAERAPNLVNWLKRQSVQVLPLPTDVRQALVQKEAEVVLEIPERYPQEFREGRTATLLLHYDRTNDRAETAVQRADALLQRYGAGLGAMRLIVRGIDPQVARPLSVEQRDVSGVHPLAAFLVSFLPYGLMFAAFFGGMYLAIDSTSGERERLTLEPLLLNPVGRGEIVLGKLAATVLFSTVSLALCVSAMAYGFTLVPALPGGLELSLSPRNALAIFLVALPLVLLASASQMLVASFTRSYREAQTWLQFFNTIPLIPSIVQLVSPVAASAGMMLVPVLSQSVLIGLIGKDREIDPLFYALSAGGTLGAGLLFAAAVAALYRREKVLG